jgi:AcrR family transcriptional regulator
MNNVKRNSNITAKKTRATRSAGQDNSAKMLILETTETLMREEGYAAVSTRRVAKEAGLKAPLVHYYFKTTDDLFIAVFRRVVGEDQERFEEDVTGPQSVNKLWGLYRNEQRTALLIEFMALANHREAIKTEFAEYAARNRKRRAKALAQSIDVEKLKAEGGSVEGLMTVMISVARNLIMEEGVGLTAGHRAAERLFKNWLRHFKA